MSLELDDELETLLAPLSAEEPCGPSMRYDPAFTEIRMDREEDDPSLPMGIWERPLKKADWVQIEGRCKTLLSSKTKDLQLAAWLLEAWLRQHQLAGLRRGLLLITELLTRYWGFVHPVVEEDGDSDARIAPIEWLNEFLPIALKIHVTLVHLVDHRPARINLADWEKMTATELSAGTSSDSSQRKDKSKENEPEITRALVISVAQKNSLQQLKQLQLDLGDCLEASLRLEGVLHEELGSAAPSVSKILQTLESMQRVVNQIMPVIEQPDPPIFEEEPLNSPIMSTEENDLSPSPINESDAQTPKTEPALVMGNWKNRDQAYKTLEMLADYLSKTEPHSPTPYLIRRAVNWGRMPLPELMAEIVREEGDLNRMMSLLGLK